MKKFLLIALFLLSLIVLAFFIGWRWLQGQAQEYLAKELDGLGWNLENLEINPGFRPCFQFESKMSATGRLRLKDLCLDSGLLQLKNASEPLRLRIAHLELEASAEDIKPLMARLQARLASAKFPGQGRLAAGQGLNLEDLSLELQSYHIRVQAEGQYEAKLSSESGAKAQWKAGEAKLETDINAIQVQYMGTSKERASFDLSFELDESKPAIRVEGALNWSEKAGQLGFKSGEGLALSLRPSSKRDSAEAWSSIPLYGFELALASERLALRFEGLDLSALRSWLSEDFKELQWIQKAAVERLTLSIQLKDFLELLQKRVNFGQMLDKIEEIQLYRAKVELNGESFLVSETLQGSGFFQFLKGYWTQEAGSILGTSPAKKEKGKGQSEQARAKAKSNPISPEVLASFKEGLQKFQTRLQDFPTLAIQEAELAWVQGEDIFILDKITFKSSDLSQDALRFHMGLSMAEARMSFDINFEESSIYPKLDIQLESLKASTFYKLINMPIPEASEGAFFARMQFSLSDVSLDIKMALSFEDFAFFHRRVSPNVVQGINAAALFDLRYDFGEDLLRFENLRLRSGPLELQGFIEISHLRSDPLLKIEVGAENVPCQHFAEAIPKGFLPTITALEMAGTQMSPSISAKIPWKDPLKLTFSESGFSNACYPSVVAPYRPEQLNSPDYTHTTQYTYFVDSITVGPGTKSYVSLQKIPPYVKAAMYLTEDKRFYDHGALRPSFIERALRLNLNHRSYVYGGSTISQQLVKNVFLDRNKNLARKLEEWFITWRMETVVPKDRIFELYLNVIEFGPDVYGIQNAAKFYFNKSVESLSPLEGAYLASLKVSPSKGGRFYLSGFPSDGWWNKRMRYIMKTLAETGYISMQDVLLEYPWVPQFYYASDKSDYRNVWINQYQNWLRKRPKRENNNEASAQEAL